MNCECNRKAHRWWHAFEIRAGPEDAKYRGMSGKSGYYAPHAEVIVVTLVELENLSVISCAFFAASSPGRPCLLSTARSGSCA
jgi:hypothetical protein